MVQRSKFLAAALLLINLTFSADAAELGRFEEAGWEGNAFTSDRTGDFTGCAISAPYNSGALLLFTLDSSYQFGIGLAHSDWLFKEGQDVFAVMKIDQGTPFSGTGTAVDTDQLKFQIESTAANYNEFRYGRILVVHFDGKKFEFDLDGTARALAKLVTCVEVYSTGQENESPATPPESVERWAQRVEAMEIATNIASTAGMEDFQIIGDDELRAQMNNPDVLWAAEGFVGVANVVDMNADFSIDEVAAIRAANSGCDAGQNTAIKRQTVKWPRNCEYSGRMFGCRWEFIADYKGLGYSGSRRLF